MEGPRLAPVPGEGRSTGGVDAVDPVVELHLTRRLQQHRQHRHQPERVQTLIEFSIGPTR